MPHVHKSRPGAKLYKKADVNKLENAKRVIASGLSYRKAAARFRIPLTMLDKLITLMPKSMMGELLLGLKFNKN